MSLYFSRWIQISVNLTVRSYSASNLAWEFICTILALSNARSSSIWIPSNEQTYTQGLLHRICIACSLMWFELVVFRFVLWSFHSLVRKVASPSLIWEREHCCLKSKPVTIFEPVVLEFESQLVLPLLEKPSIWTEFIQSSMLHWGLTSVTSHHFYY